MKKQAHNLAAVIAVGLFAGTSGIAMAEVVETQHSAYQLAARLSAPAMQAGQAGPAGPSEIPGRTGAASDWTPLETRYSAYEFIRETAAALVGQAGRAGPVAIGGRPDQSVVYETQHGAHELMNRP